MSLSKRDYMCIEEASIRVRVEVCMFLVLEACTCCAVESFVNILIFKK